MWFGDLVTMRWFDDVWMKEVFANFFAAKIVNPAFPEHRPRPPVSCSRTTLPPTRWIARPARTPSASRSTTSRTRARSTAPSSTRRRPSSCASSNDCSERRRSATACASTSKAHAFGNASWPDLIARARRTHAGRPRRVEPRVGGGSRRPPVGPDRIALDGDGAIRSLVLVQHDPPGRGRVWPQALEVLAGDRRGRRPGILPWHSDARAVEVRAAAGLAGPALRAAHGRRPRLRRLRPRRREPRVPDGRPAAIAPALTRGAALVTLWEDVAQGRSRPDAWMAWRRARCLASATSRT